MSTSNKIATVAGALTFILIKTVIAVSERIERDNCARIIKEASELGYLTISGAFPNSTNGSYKVEKVKEEER